MPIQSTRCAAAEQCPLVPPRHFLLLPGLLSLVLGSALTSVATAQSAGQNSDDWCAISGDLVLTNGRFLTVDADDSIQSTVRIRGDRIVAVGDVGSYDCDRQIDLGG